MRIHYYEKDEKHHYAILSYSGELKMTSVPYANKKNALKSAKHLISLINGKNKAKLDTSWGIPVDRTNRISSRYL